MHQVKKGHLVKFITPGPKTFKGGVKAKSAFSRKRIPLCHKHHKKWHKLTYSKSNKKCLCNVIVSDSNIT